MPNISAESDPEPDERGPVIFVGQDGAGHWLVQDGGKKLEGRFVSRGAALRFAAAERDTYHARLQMAVAPMVPVVPFEPLPPAVTTSTRAMRWSLS